MPFLGITVKDKERDKDKSLEKTARPRERGRQPMDCFFRPASVAVIGATEKAGSIGRTILWNLIGSPFGGTVFPVNPVRASVLDIPAYPSVAAIPEPPELAVIVTPAATVPGIVDQCGEIGVKGAIVISAGFGETGEEGEALEAQVLARARRTGMRVIGPNCFGLMSPLTGLNATFANAMARPGSVAFLSQSGALCAAVLDWSFKEHVGFSAFVSLGSMLDVGWADLLDSLGHDPATRSIVLYMESIGNARAFLSAAREIALAKPIIVIKVGRAGAAAGAGLHAGARTGNDEVFDAAFRRCGVLRVETIAELFHLADVLSKQPRPRGPRLTILTNAGGAGVLAADALLAGGGQLAELSDETITALNAILPPHWTRGNPVDVLGDADPARYARALEIVSGDEHGDGTLVVLTPQPMTDPTQTAEQIRALAGTGDKPLLASWMGGPEVAAGEAILNRADIPTFPYPDTAAQAFVQMWQYSSNLRALYETPRLPAHMSAEPAGARRLAGALIDSVRQAGRGQLTEIESKALLAAYEIPTVFTRHAASEDEAVRTARALGYPVVLKLHSETIARKAAVGGVRLNVANDEAVRQAYRAIAGSLREKGRDAEFGGVTVQPMVSASGYEIALGCRLDQQFGPVLLFGSGGPLAEAHLDRALGLPPLTTTLARRLMERTAVFRAMQGTGGERAVDFDRLAELLVRFSQLVVEQRWIEEIDVNPILVSSDEVVALDARVAVHPAHVALADLPPLAIRPYPTQYVAPFTLKNGTNVLIRPIRPEDEPLMVRFHETLSDRSVYFRYFHLVKLGQRVSHERLARVCFIDYDRDMALVVELPQAEGGPRIVGVGRLTKQRGSSTAEFAMVLSDEVQGLGLGTELLKRLVQIGKDEGVDRIVADILPDNKDMQAVSEKVGFRCRYVAEEGVVKAELVTAASCSLE